MLAAEVAAHVRSACEPHRAWIEAQVSLGRNATAAGVPVNRDDSTMAERIRSRAVLSFQPFRDRYGQDPLRKRDADRIGFTYRFPANERLRTDFHGCHLLAYPGISRRPVTGLIGEEDAIAKQSRADRTRPKLDEINPQVRSLLHLIVRSGPM